VDPRITGARVRVPSTVNAAHSTAGVAVPKTIAMLVASHPLEIVTIPMLRFHIRRLAARKARPPRLVRKALCGLPTSASPNQLLLVDRSFPLQ